MGQVIDMNKYKRRKVKGMKDISIEKKIEIERIVNRIISNLDLSVSPSVDIVMLVKNDNFLVKTAELPLNTTGCLIVNENEFIDNKNTHRLIMVNKTFKNPDNEENVVLKKSRFITAHEYGHFILHKKPEEALYAHRDSDKRNSTEELEADYFARSILMPAKNFLEAISIIEESLKKYVYKTNNIKNIRDKYIFEILSDYFKVTKAKVLKRMEDIDVLKSITN